MEILNDLIEKQEKLEQRFVEIEELLKKNLNRPLPPAKVETKLIGQELKTYLGDTSQKFKELESRIEEHIEKIPSSIRVGENFIGFSSRISAIIFLSVLGILSCILGGLCYHHYNQAQEQGRLVASYESDFQKVSKRNPKLAARYRRATLGD